MCERIQTAIVFIRIGYSVPLPTVSLGRIIKTLLIGAYEGRKHIAFDIPGAFLQAEMPEYELVSLRFKIVEMLGEINENYIQHIQYEKGKKVLYVKVIEAIYSCIVSALPWYKLLSKTLQKLGFTLNPYDKCIANKMINGKQMTISWHVDDCIVSHVNNND